MDCVKHNGVKLGLYDTQWTNCVNDPQVLAFDTSKEDAVHRAVALAEKYCIDNAKEAISAADAAQPVPNNNEIYGLLASAWFYGDWIAETAGERRMQEIMESAGWWPIASEDELIAKLSLPCNTIAVPDEQPNDTQWWLVSLDQYGNPKLEDGTHRSRDGANQALYIIKSLNLGRGHKFAVAKIELFDAVPSSEVVNYDALSVLNAAKKSE